MLIIQLYTDNSKIKAMYKYALAVESEPTFAYDMSL